MTAHSRVYLPIEEEVVVHMVRDQVMDWPNRKLNSNLRILERYHVSTLVLVLFGFGESRDRVIFYLAGMPSTMFIANILSYSPNELTEKFGVSLDDVEYIVHALYRLEDVLLDRQDEYPLRVDRPAKWPLLPIALPPGDSATAFEALSKVANSSAKWHRADFLFPYERPELVINRFDIPNTEKMRFTFTLAAQLHGDDIGKLRHYMAERDRADLRMLAQLAGNTTTNTIGAMLENTAASIERRFGLNRDQITHLLRGLHSLEYSLILLSEIKRRGLAD
ncbi:MAG: hypothetical protein WBP12_01590 [Candidatus Saccharimonas sp.]